MVDGKNFKENKKSISNFKDLDQSQHTGDWILSSENLSLYEVALSDEKINTVLTSKKAKEK